ncbi:TrkA-N domain protein [Alkalidesulfovibrio alkalitolerans DSM 16529]|uniref:Trk system potassium uptake protein TrkA n=1 Tax=Alkalidesulfovibrio alkalitolerans DSM 16529 TaxID=1121439 RepID=S7UFG0_9BACT|nr:Trk system potassium transporter TrkA [Alkalidesulfovibrio alkalitolerans]EPR30953.1 TrkA-N domain protein [Alkalidesulfovibrio alkalitolerans DSM 16529]
MRIVIVGAGEVGFHIARRLSREDKEVVVVDKNPEALRRVSEHLDAQTILGSGSSPKVLIEAGIKGADILLAVTDSDDANIMSCLFARALAPQITKVARIRNEEYTEFQDALARDILNISMVINPEVETVKTVLNLVRLPGAREVNEFADGRISMVGVRATPGSVLSGLKLTEVRSVLGGVDLIVGAIVRGSELIVPTGRDVINDGDLVYFACATHDRQKAMERFGKQQKAARNILVVGGGAIGLRLCRALEKERYRVKLIETSAERCELLSAQLDNTTVLCGDGTDQDLLREENASAMDMVVALTGDDETNVLTCLLAKSMGARRAIARVNKFAYVPLIQAIGLDNVVSTRLSAINSILHAIRRGKVISTALLQGDEAEIMEAIALEHSAIVDRPIKDLDFPRGALILCVMRGDEVRVPTGDFVVKPKDRVIILSAREAVQTVEKSLMVRLEHF